MKIFIINIILFMLILFLAIFIVGRNYNNSEEKSDYLYAIVDKHNLINRTNPPRLILCGGSNLAFGVDSKRIEDSIGLPTINMGLSAGFGLKFIMSEVKSIVQPSDIVIISIEYFMPVEGIYTIMKRVAKIYPVANNYYKKDLYIEIKNFLKNDVFIEEIHENFHINVKRVFLSKKNQKKYLTNISIYARQSFNAYGDVIAHLDAPPPNELEDIEKMTYEKWKGIKYLNEFAEYAKLNNIKVYFIFPSYPQSEYTKNQDVILRYATDLKKELNIQILKDPNDFVFADSLFYNTVYHLNKLGREKRTTILIDILKSQIHY